MSNERKCPRCGQRKENPLDDFCNDCEVGAIHAYQNLRKSGKTHEEAALIAFGTSTTHE